MQLLAIVLAAPGYWSVVVTGLFAKLTRGSTIIPLELLDGVAGKELEATADEVWYRDVIDEL